MTIQRLHKKNAVKDYDDILGDEKVRLVGKIIWKVEV